MEEDYSVDGCPFRKLGLKGDGDNSFSCYLTGGADADHRGWGYDSCSFSGKDFRECPAFRANESKLVKAVKAD
jgi:hypothetical protein